MHDWLDRQFPPDHAPPRRSEAPSWHRLVNTQRPDPPRSDVLGALAAYLIGAAITAVWCVFLWWAVRRWVVGA
jgi:hypothetical protein